jgi:hypothetical protein
MVRDCRIGGHFLFRIAYSKIANPRLLFHSTLS